MSVRRNQNKGGPAGPCMVPSRQSRRAVSDQAAVSASVHASIARELRNKGERQCGHIR
jgi:hypothetical protein